MASWRSLQLGGTRMGCSAVGTQGCGDEPGIWWETGVQGSVRPEGDEQIDLFQRKKKAPMVVGCLMDS